MSREAANNHYPGFHASARIRSYSSRWQGKLLTLKVGLLTQERIWNEMLALPFLTTGVSSSNWLFLELGKVVVVSQGQD